jgi:hypothetical protein
MFHRNRNLTTGPSSMFPKIGSDVLYYIYIVYYICICILIPHDTTTVAEKKLPKHRLGRLGRLGRLAVTELRLERDHLAPRVDLEMLQGPKSPAFRCSKHILWDFNGIL